MTVTFTATGDVSALEREYMRLQKQYAGLSAELAKLTAAQGDFERSGADAAKIKNLAAQQYVATVRILSDELRKGTITQAQHDAQLAAAKEKYAAITKEAKDQAAAAKELHAASKQTSDVFSKMPNPLQQTQSYVTGLVTGFAATYLSVQGVVALMGEWRDKQRALREDQRRTQLDVAGAEAEAIQMLGTGKTKEEKTAFLNEVKQINKETGFGDMKAMYMASANVLSSTGGDPALTGKILRATAPLKKFRPDELESLAGSTADLATITGAKTDEDVQKTVGLVLNITSQARIKNLESFKNAAPALAAVANLDKGGDKLGSLTEAGAIFAAIGGAVKDPEGSLTKTATAEVAGALERMLPELGTTRERMAKVRSDPELQKEFWSKHGEEIEKKPGFRGPIIPAIRALLTDPTSEIARRYETAQKTLAGAGGEQALTDYRSMVADLGGITPELSLAASSKQSAAALQDFDIRSKGGKRAELADQVSKVKDRVQTFEGWIHDKTVGAVGRWIARKAGVSEEEIAAGEMAMLSGQQQKGRSLREWAFGVRGGQSSLVRHDEESKALVETERARTETAMVESQQTAAERTAAATEKLVETVANRPQVGTSAMASWGQGAMREGR